MKKRLIALAMALALTLTLAPLTRAQADDAFTDVPDTHPHKFAIDYSVEYGFFKGKGGGLFGPDDEITREQLAVVWARTFQARIPQFTDATQPRDEVDNAIILMYALRYMNGVSDTVFGHYGFATREQVLCITQRAYLKGVDGDDAYQQYSDAASISDWAKSSVGACLKSDLLDGVFSGDALQPQKAITRAEVAQIIFNVMKSMHTITVEPSEGGTVTASKETAYPGETITVEVTPDENMRLVAGSLKYNGTAISGTSFVMPNRNVTITAEFEEVPVVTLVDIEITTDPQTAYLVGDTLDLAGMEVTAHYDDESSRVVTGWTADPEDGTTLEVESTFDLTVTYTEGEETATAELSITVTADEEPTEPET